MQNPKLVVVSTRVTVPLAETIQKYLLADSHVSPADFVRAAIREKLKRDAPQLFLEMYQQKPKPGREDEK